MSEDWRKALAPTPECVAIERLGEELSAAERAHVETCVRCQTELALLREVMSEESSPESQWIAEKLRTAGVPPADEWASRPRVRAGETPARQPAGRRRSVWYAVAAALVILIGAGTWMQLREPGIDAPAGGIYRSGRLELLTPRGDVPQAPNELRWLAVPKASRYYVRILEVDATEVWSGDTTQPRVALPPDVISQFAPGKRLQWEVQAFRGNEVLASSETQDVRVIP